VSCSCFFSVVLVVSQWCLWELRALRQHLEACGALGEDSEVAAAADAKAAQQQQQQAEAEVARERAGVSSSGDKGQSRRASPAKTGGGSGGNSRNGSTGGGGLPRWPRLPSAEEALAAQAAARASGALAMERALESGCARLRVLLAQVEAACLRAAGGGSLAKPFPPRDAWASGRRPKLHKAQQLPHAWPPPAESSGIKRDQGE
jgi:hypothetical protein